MTRISVRNHILCFCLKLYLKTHAFDIKRGRHLFFRRKTILVRNWYFVNLLKDKYRLHIFVFFMIFQSEPFWVKGIFTPKAPTEAFLKLILSGASLMILVHPTSKHLKLLLNVISNHKDLIPICSCITLICMCHIFCLENYEDLALKSLWGP